jgi:hypothetical protein
MRSRIEPMKKIARTLRSHRTLLALYHALGKLPEPDVAHRLF